MVCNLVAMARAARWVPNFSRLKSILCFFYFKYIGLWNELWPNGHQPGIRPTCWWLWTRIQEHAKWCRCARWPRISQSATLSEDHAGDELAQRALVSRHIFPPLYKFKKKFSLAPPWTNSVAEDRAITIAPCPESVAPRAKYIVETVETATAIKTLTFSQRCALTRYLYYGLKLKRVCL